MSFTTSKLVFGGESYTWLVDKYPESLKPWPAEWFELEPGLAEWFELGSILSTTSVLFIEVPFYPSWFLGVLISAQSDERLS